MKERIVEALRRAAHENGAKDGIYLPAEQVTVNLDFRRICQSNGCGRYDRCYMCPPDIGDAETLTAQIKAYPHAFLYQSVSTIEDSFDFEGMMEAAQKHTLLSAAIQDAAKAIFRQAFLHLSSGCRHCERCAKMDGLPCRNPDKALPAMEGYCVDVYQTVKNTALKYANGKNTVTYFGMILFSE